jgi:sulfur relay (sulfurtransferase) DsrC/TusE family protein
MQETLLGLIKEHYIFPYEKEQIGKNVMMKRISNAHWRFIHALNKYYVQRGLSPLNRFGYITSNEWDTFVQQHTTT